MIGINKLRHIRMSTECTLWSLIFYIRARYLWNIKLGKACRCCGNTILKKAPGSSIKIGNHCRFISSANSFNLIGINRPCIIATHISQSNLEIGDHSGFSGTVIGAFKSIKIGKNVKCGANSLITDSDWHLQDPRSGKCRPVKIGDNVWLGEGVKVLKGVTIGENSVIGAGSVVTKDIPGNVIAAGNPAKVISRIEN